jgi:hypothetical protein
MEGFTGAIVSYTADIAIRPAEKHYTLYVTNDKQQMVVGLLADGSLEFGEGYTPEDAAKRFWEALNEIVKGQAGE